MPRALAPQALAVGFQDVGTFNRLQKVRAQIMYQVFVFFRFSQITPSSAFDFSSAQLCPGLSSLAQLSSAQRSVAQRRAAQCRALPCAAVRCVAVWSCCPAVLSPSYIPCIKQKNQVPGHVCTYIESQKKLWRARYHTKVPCTRACTYIEPQKSTRAELSLASSVKNRSAVQCRAVSRPAVRCGAVPCCVVFCCAFSFVHSRHQPGIIRTYNHKKNTPRVVQLSAATQRSAGQRRAVPCSALRCGALPCCIVLRIYQVSYESTR